MKKIAFIVRDLAGGGVERTLFSSADNFCRTLTQFKEKFDILYNLIS